MNSISNIVITFIPHTDSAWNKEIKVSKRWVNGKYKSMSAQTRSIDGDAACN